MRHQKLLFAIWGVSFLFVISSVYGGYLSYSGVPHWDMWNGGVEFFMKASDGDWSVWWKQHNEHRIVLTRILFWLDFVLFSGVQWPLVVVNYILVLSSVCIFSLFLKEMGIGKNETIAGAAFLVAWLFQWMQNQNLSGAFQSQFFLAQLLPLAGFYCLYKSREYPGLFAIAVVLGVMALGTMASGILALPLMFVFSVLSNRKLYQRACLLLLSIGGIFLYFYRYRVPPDQDGFLAVLSKHHVDLVAYTLTYLGSPFDKIFQGGQVGYVVAVMSAAVMAALSARLLFQAVTRRQADTPQFALLLFIIYIAASAFGASSGRIELGIEQALSSRYATPALMAWAALCVAFAPQIFAAGRKYPVRVFVCVTALVSFMLVEQASALKYDPQANFNRKVATLALEIGARDDSKFGYLFPKARVLEKIANEASERNLSVFATEPFMDLRQKLDGAYEGKPHLTCMGAVDGIGNLEADRKFVAIEGWFFDPVSREVPELLSIVDEAGKLVGFAMTGKPRHDVEDVPELAVVNAGFEGYMKAELAGEVVQILGQDGCGIRRQTPALWFSRMKSVPSADRSGALATGDIVRSEWDGSDFYKSSFDGMDVYGSYVHSDKDVGFIELKVKQNSVLYYRSGPSSGGQILRAPGYKPLQLPMSLEWTILQLHFKGHPSGELVVRLEDNGKSWGQWSAIAVRHSE